MAKNYKLKIADDCGDKLGVHDDDELTNIGVALLRVALADEFADGASSIMNGWVVSVFPDDDDHETYHMTVSK